MIEDHARHGAIKGVLPHLQQGQVVLLVCDENVKRGDAEIPTGGYIDRVRETHAYVTMLVRRRGGEKLFARFDHMVRGCNYAR